MTTYPAGSEWRKWDLHVHPPGTRLSDGYGTPRDLDRFCRVLEESDVQVFGITDYFSADVTFEAIARHGELFPGSTKVFFPNVELRLNEVVNGAQESVDIHLLFRPDTSKECVDRLLQELKTEITDANRRKLRCTELSTEAQIKSATVMRESIEYAITQTFGDTGRRTDNVLIIVPANNSGIRAAPGSKRKAVLADQIDKLTDAIFGSFINSAYFLKTDRFEDRTQSSTPKPVFSGSDAHRFEDLEAWLGKEILNNENRKEVTWIKADPTFEGLLQTLVEPEQRVRIQAIKPDHREPYQYISKVRFSGTNDFPSEIPLNQNLSSIIGTRSSGKSALLAYISHAIDADYTISQQVATGLVSRQNTGPAAGKTWVSVQHIKCEVEWGDPNVKSGKVIYIPQNSLYAISDRPNEITGKIQPVLYRHAPEFKNAHLRTVAEIDNANSRLRSSVAEWFKTLDSIRKAADDLRSLGDKSAIIATRGSLDAKIAVLRESSQLTHEDVAAYQFVVEQLGEHETAIKSVSSELGLLDLHLPVSDGGQGAASEPIATVQIQSRPSPEDLPATLRERIKAILSEATPELSRKVSAEIVSYRLELEAQKLNHERTIVKLREDHRALIERNQANAELEDLVQNRKKQDDLLATIARQETHSVELNQVWTTIGSEITNELEGRSQSIANLQEVFASTVTPLGDGMSFGIEAKIPNEAIDEISQAFNLKNVSDYVDRENQTVRVETMQQGPISFLLHMAAESQKVKRGQTPAHVAADALALTPEVRFFAELDGDRIGGFTGSSMTPGKQALFALTLILDETIEAWPLLIDQPEDDLDSRSIYEHIVPYIVKRKAGRQILMVSHNANLVVGADSEQIIVANRHGEDRKNRNGQMFDYRSGSLESTLKPNGSEIVLDSRGIREHACEVLDGGHIAFQKRRDKYKL